jgi:hypothetical protein
MVAMVLTGCATSSTPAPGATSTAATSVPRSSSAASARFADGSPFDNQCSIAWPTKPVVSATTIQLTLTCANVPSSMYVFVVAVYNDPTLAVTRATTTVHVRGEISDSALTSTGLSYLIVQAREISL